MKTINLKVCGDSWLNIDQVNDQLSGIDPTEWVCFDTGAEGISLEHSGILKFITQWATNTNHTPHRIVVNNPNNYEKTQYKNLCEAPANHFFPMSAQYQTVVPCIDPWATLFGCFLGRHTVQRDQIAQDVVTNYQGHVLMSIMKSRYAVNPWNNKLHSVESIDNMSINDQYTNEINTNLSLLQHYHQFQIEIVAETMCMGKTFFPTEKTIRPIVGTRPFLIFGPINHLTNLQQLGFKTYSTCWDESYDQLEGVDRWQAIQKLMNTIIKYGYDINQAQVIADHNHQHLKRWHQHTVPKNTYGTMNDH
jgi:hypothetical protein